MLGGEKEAIVQQAKYENLRRHLESARGDEVPMTFVEIERLIGAPLPDSARRHRAWWSNNGSNNVAVRYWRGVGRKTAKVDMAAERLIFVRERDQPGGETTIVQSPPGKTADQVGRLILAFDALPLVVQAALLRDGGDEEAVVRLLEDGVIARRRALLDRWAQNPATQSSSAELIREDRDAR